MAIAHVASPSQQAGYIVVAHTKKISPIAKQIPHLNYHDKQYIYPGDDTRLLNRYSNTYLAARKILRHHFSDPGTRSVVAANVFTPIREVILSFPMHFFSTLNVCHPGTFVVRWKLNIRKLRIWVARIPDK